MTIYERIMNARKVKGADRANLGLLAGEICIDGKPIGDADAIKKLSAMVKVCGKNIKIYKERDKAGHALEETVFAAMIEGFLPKGASEEDVFKTIEFLKVGKSMKVMGKVMGHLKKSFAVVDGNMVKSILMGEV